MLGAEFSVKIVIMSNNQPQITMSINRETPRHFF